MENLITKEVLEIIDKCRYSGKSDVIVAENDTWRVKYHFIKDDLSNRYVELKALNKMTMYDSWLEILWQTVDDFVDGDREIMIKHANEILDKYGNKTN